MKNPCFIYFTALILNAFVSCNNPSNNAATEDDSKRFGTTDSNPLLVPKSKRTTVTVKYICDNDIPATVVYDNTNPKNRTAEVAIGDLKKRKMKLVKSASGARYSDGEMVWLNKGNIGFLIQEGKKGKILYNNCNEFNALKP